MFTKYKYLIYNYSYQNRMAYGLFAYKQIDETTPKLKKVIKSIPTN